MLSVASLLNPAPPSPVPSPPPGQSRPILESSPSPTISGTDDDDHIIRRYDVPYRSKLAKAPSNGLTRSAIKGVVEFPPFDADLDEDALREARRFRVGPLGAIRDNCYCIPYVTSKKCFYEKTGREGLEVFQYDFHVPGDERAYSVMWDYNNGLVRMTDFFRCCGFSKTTPGKVLSQNPGLKDITLGVTGGCIRAQGYWMPFACARAVCATFCHAIAGALIPIFGPDFPSRCAPPEGPGYRRMVIDPEIVAESARKAEMFRCFFMAAQRGVGRYTGSASPGLSNHTRRGRDRHQLRTTVLDRDNSPYGTDAEGDAYSAPGSPPVVLGSPSPYMSPLSPPPLRHHDTISSTGSATIAASSPAPTALSTQQQHMSRLAARAHTHHHHRYFRGDEHQTTARAPGGGGGPRSTPDPWLTAVPRNPPPVPSNINTRQLQRPIYSAAAAAAQHYVLSRAHHHDQQQEQQRSGKRRAEYDHSEVEAVDVFDYDGGESQSERSRRSSRSSVSPLTTHSSPYVEQQPVALPAPPQTTRHARDQSQASHPTVGGLGENNNEQREREQQQQQPEHHHEQNAALMLLHLSVVNSDSDKEESTKTGSAVATCANTGGHDGNVDDHNRYTRISGIVSPTATATATATAASTSTGPAPPNMCTLAITAAAALSVAGEHDRLLHRRKRRRAVSVPLPDREPPPSFF